MVTPQRGPSLALAQVLENSKRYVHIDSSCAYDVLDASTEHGEVTEYSTHNVARLSALSRADPVRRTHWKGIVTLPGVTLFHDYFAKQMNKRRLNHYGTYSGYTAVRGADTNRISVSTDNTKTILQLISATRDSP
ncbi:hypothetical protein J6590_088129 [Homalodisca vitripennis]|nr:hypothetical protein J6590_088129 [Homalodisca vitripennis]